MDSERGTLQECGTSQRGVGQLWNVMCLVYANWVISHAKDYAKAFDPVDHNKLEKILKEMGIPDHLTCLLRNLYAGQEATVRDRKSTRLNSSHR